MHAGYRFSISLKSLLTRSVDFTPHY
jgi:hypothetical protein